MSTKRRLAVLVTALCTVSAGLAAGATVNTADARSPSAGQSVEVLVKRDHKIVMPSQIQPGVSTFDIRFRRATAGFQIVQADPGYRKRELVRDANAAFTKNRIPALRRLEAHVTLLGGMSARSDKTAKFSVDLPEGTYWAFDTQPQRIRAADLLTFSVAGTSVGGSLSGHVIRAVGDHSWAKTPRRIPTRGQILFENHASANHFLLIGELAKGKTIKDFARWVAKAKKGSQAPPPVRETGGMDTGVISPGKSMSFPYHLRPGRYVMVCFWPDADEGGAPHLFLGMYRGLKVG